MTYELDSNTGFPAAPDGHIWVLEEENPYYYGFVGETLDYRLTLVKIENRRRPVLRWLFGEVRTRVTSTTITTDGINRLTPSDVREAAEKIIKIVEDLNYTRKVREDNKSLLGEYPPNTL